MINREKVIMAWECLTVDEPGCPNIDCPYMGAMALCDQQRIIADTLVLLRAQSTLEQRIKDKIAGINPEVEGMTGAEFDLGCIQGLRWALREIWRDEDAAEG